MVRFPKWAPWWQAARAQMLQFDKGEHDDFLACISEVGRGLESLSRPEPPETEEDLVAKLAAMPSGITMGQLKEMAAMSVPKVKYDGR